MGYDILEDIIILLATSVVMVALFRRLQLPPILAYLLVGLIVGPNGMGWISSTEDTRFLAEFGVVFLLFTIGLEFSFPQLIAMRSKVLGLGGAQVFVSSVIFGLVAWLLGVSPVGALIIGGILALSSTAIVTKQLIEQLELHSRHGRMALGILLFQDLAVVPLLVIIPILAGNSANGMVLPLVIALAKATLIFLITLAIGRWLLRPLFKEVARARSAELFTLTVLLIALAAAWGTHAAGLSLALGGFLAGMMIGETEYRHQVETDIRPFQDVFLGLFFITVGMLIDLQLLASIWPWALLLSAGLIITKIVIILTLVRAYGAESGIALRTAVVLAQGGEFGFALLAMALNSALLGDTVTQSVLFAILLSMIAAPILIRYNGLFAKTLYAFSYHNNRDKIALEIEHGADQLADHVIICGYGRVGQNLARLLEQESIPYLALDLDPVRIQEAVVAGDEIHYGDSTHSRILEAAGLRSARLLVISFDDNTSAMKILTQVRKLRPELPVLVRTRDDSHLEHLQAAGATEVVPETLEASMMLGAHMMSLLQLPVARIMNTMQSVRADRYHLLRAYFHGEDKPQITSSVKQLHSLTLPDHAHAIGHSLLELKLDDIDVNVTSMLRCGIRTTELDPEAHFRAGDVLVLYGLPKDVLKAEDLLLNG